MTNTVTPYGVVVEAEDRCSCFFFFDSRSENFKFQISNFEISNFEIEIIMIYRVWCMCVVVVVIQLSLSPRGDNEETGGVSPLFW